MSKYTPGPWNYNETYGLIMAGKEVEVAACHAGSGTDTKANARLIASAPDLLSVLEDVKEYLEDGHTPTPDVVSEMRRVVAAVIAKAEGKE